MRNWFFFVVVSSIWGSSFLLIKIGVASVDPLVLVSARTAIAAVCFATALMVLKLRPPRDRRSVLVIIAIGLLNTAIPFTLITWSETMVDSGLAGVLNGTTPLFSLVIAHLALHDDKITLRKTIGLISGFAGVVLLATRGASVSGHTNPLIGQLAMLAASCSYAVTAVLIRRYLRGVDPMLVAGGSMLVGAGVTLVVMLVSVHPLPVIAAVPIGAIAAIVTLGILNTFVANSLYFRLLNAWGASRATMVTYTAATVSLFLGAIFNNEELDTKLLIGAVMIIGGVAIVNFRRMAAQANSPAAEPSQP